MFFEERPRFLSFGHALVSFIVCGVLLVAGVAVFRSLQPMLQASQEESNDSSKKKTELEELNKRIAQREAETRSLDAKIRSLIGSEARAKQVAAETRAQNEVFRRQAAAIKQEFETLKSRLTAWQVFWRELKSNELGRRIVASKSHLEFFVEVGQKPRVSEKDLDRTGATIDGLLKPFETLESQRGSAPVSDDHRRQLDTVATDVRLVLSELEEDHSVAQQLLEEVKHLDLEPAEVTLEEALAFRRSHEARAQADAVEGARRRAIEEKTRILERAEQERVMAEAALEAARKRRIAIAKQNQQEKEQEKFARQQAREQLLREMDADSADISSFLMGFITPGYRQLTKSGSMVQTSEKKPLSFSAIESLGALETTLKGLHTLHQIGAQLANDRPTGALPVWNSRLSVERVPRTRRQVERAQELLIKYGELLMDRKDLQP